MGQADRVLEHEVELRPATPADAETFAASEADEIFCAQAGWMPHASQQDWRMRTRVDR